MRVNYIYICTGSIHLLKSIFSVSECPDYGILMISIQLHGHIFDDIDINIVQYL